MSHDTAGIPFMDSQIAEELQRLAKLQFGDFAAISAFLYQPDAFRELLEPAFSSDTGIDPSQDLFYVTSKSGPELEDRDRVWLASIAWEEGRAYSANPGLDDRLGQSAKKFYARSGRFKSLMAARIDVAESPVAVLVVLSSRTIDLPPEREQIALNELQESIGPLQHLLMQRRSFAAELNCQRYRKFFTETLSCINSSLTIRQTLAGMASRLAALLSAESVHLRLNHTEANWYSTGDDNSDSSFYREDLQEALNSIADWRSDEQATAINRPDSLSRLKSSFANWGAGNAWCRVQNPHVICVLRRKVQSFSDHWSETDTTFLLDAISLLSSALTRAQRFEVLLKDAGHRGTQQQFSFWCYLLDVHFGIDQVLVTKVCRNHREFKIKAKPGMNIGFRSPGIDSRPKVYDPERPALAAGVPDIMVRILIDHLAQSHDALNVYVASCESPVTESFTLDLELIEKCGLTGPILFVPCNYFDTESSCPELVSILHLSSSKGHLNVSPDQFPVLQMLGQRVAAMLHEQDESRVSASVQEIRDIHKADIKSTASACRSLATETRAVGCALFLNAQNIGLLGIPGPSIEVLSEALTYLFQHYGIWASMFTDREVKSLESMFSAFLGITTFKLRQILSSVPDRNMFASLLAPHLYLRVVSIADGIASTPVEDMLHPLRRLNTNSMSDSREVAHSFGKFLSAECYFPGFGLTGWVLRFNCPLFLKNKRQETVLRATREAQYQRVRPLGIGEIINALGLMGVDGRATTWARDSLNEPSHVNHVPDYERCTAEDSFIAVPIDGVGISELPAGVIRMSSAATMRNSFRTRDEVAVAAVAKHFADVLRIEQMSQAAYLENMLSDRGSAIDRQHTFRRLDENVGKLSEWFRSNRVLAKDQDTFETTVLRLKEICAKALAFDKHQVLALEVRGSVLEKWDVFEFVDRLLSWLNATGIRVDIKAVGRAGVPSILREAIIPAFRVTEEVIRNCRRYGAPSSGDHLGGIRVLVSEDSTILVFVSERADLTAAQFERIDWVDYGELSKGQSSGGGMRLLRDSQYTSKIYVDFGVSHMECVNGHVYRVRMPLKGRVFA